MFVKKPEPEVQGWDDAEAALAAAQRMPGGPERIAAFKKAGQLQPTSAAGQSEIRNTHQESS
jgi:hypothetical protein